MSAERIHLPQENCSSVKSEGKEKTENQEQLKADKSSNKFIITIYTLHIREP